MTQKISQQYKIIKAEISAERLGPATIDVRAMIGELNLFETLEKPYLTGTVLLLDDKSIMDKLNFRGTEKITIEISSVADINEPRIGGPEGKEKTFLMTKIEKTIRTNDKTEVNLITLVEEHFFFDKLIKVSKSYTAYLEGIMTEIFVGSLNKNVDQSYLTKSAQGVRKINVPYMHPLEAVDWIRDRATTELGGPFFTYSSVFDNNIRIASLDGLLGKSSFNSRTPFIYSSAMAQKSEDLSEEQRSFLIEGFKMSASEDSMKMVSKGALGSLYTNTDIGTGLTSRDRFSIRDILSEMKSRDLIPPESSQSVFDENQFFINKYADQYDSKVYHQITSSGTYDKFQGYHDVTDSREHTLKLKNISIRNALYRNMLNVVVPGVAFMYAKISVGDIMRCQFASSVDDAKVNDTESLTDRQKSGDYLIYAVRHMFRGTKHSASVNITKLTKDYLSSSK